jgi:tRNA(Arg) A34 adenosine deaminase TadA
MMDLSTSERKENCADAEYCAVLNKNVVLIKLIGANKNGILEHMVMRASLQMAKAQGEHYFLKDMTVVLDVEPCFMCAMALVHSRVGTLVFKHRNLQDGGIATEHRGRSAQIYNVK